MDRRAFIGTVTGTLLAAPFAAEAQQPEKVYRIGILTNKPSDPAEAHLWQAFQLGLRERGWIEGRNILIEFREAEGNLARLPELAADLVRLKVDLILARASTFVQPAKAATSSIPIVFVVHADPEGTGHVASLARPGGNITGLANLQTDLGPKGLELLISAVPVAMIVCPVTFPPGRARLATIPVPTGSPIGPVTTGIVLVTLFAARLPGVVYATMMSGLRRTHSAARAGNRSYWPSAERKSMVMVRPST